MANPRKLSRADLVLWTANAATAVADGKVTGFLVAQNTAISDGLTDKNAELAASDTTQIETHALSMSATSTAQFTEEQLQALIADLKFSMRGVNATAAEYEAVGFDAPDTFRSAVVPHTPTNLAATA